MLASWNCGEYRGMTAIPTQTRLVLVRLLYLPLVVLALVLVAVLGHTKSRRA
jgi:hypothetical protein